MLENDIYVSTSPYKDVSLKEAVERINRTLGASASNIADLLILISAYTIHFSHEELKRLLPDSPSAYNNHVVVGGIRPLCEDKIIQKKSLTKPIGASKVVFMFQKKGEDRAQEIRGGRLTVRYPRRFTKDKVKDDKVRTHTYCTGMNLFQMLSLEIPLEWERERSYPEGYQKGKYRELQIDGTCRLYPGDNDHGRVIYFEQDMSTENLLELVAKLEFYERYHLMDDLNSMIVYSFYDAKRGIINLNHHLVNPYSNGSADKLLAFMEEKGCNTIDEVIDLGYTDEEYIRALKAMVKEADEYGLDETARNHLNGTQITRDFVRDFARTLTSRTNPYQARDLNTKHVDLTKNKIRGLATILLKNTYDTTIRYMEPIRKGMQVLGVPTPLVANRIPYALISWNKDKQEEIKTALAPYFGQLTFVAERSKSLNIDYFKNIKTKIALRNVFSYNLPNGKQGFVCVEMPFMDIGAWVRVKMFAEGYADDTPISVVCVLEDKKQAAAFFSAIPYEHDHIGVPLDIEGICGIYGSYLRSLSTLLVPDGDGGLFHLPSPDRHKA